MSTKVSTGSITQKKWIVRLVLLVLAAAAFGWLLFFANKDKPQYTTTESTGIEYEVARVTAIIEDKTTVDETTENILRGERELEIELLTGRYAGDKVKVTNYFSALYNVNVKTGDKVSVRIDTVEENQYQVSIYNYYRVPGILGVVGCFLLFLILIGGKKGAKSAVGLIFTMVCIIFILLPLSLKGYSALAITLGLILVCNFVTFFLVDGIGKKTVVASVGSMAGVLCGTLFAVIAAAIMKVTAFQMDEAETLLLIASGTELKIHDLFICGILIACMGAVMDVSMSITSSIAELHEVNPGLNKKQLFQSGMNIGKDAMGTMSNTLILAFAGESLNMMLMIYSYGVSFQQLMNTDFVAIEVIRSIAGSIGIVCTVPLVAMIAAEIYGKKSKRMEGK